MIEFFCHSRGDLISLFLMGVCVGVFVGYVICREVWRPADD